MPCPAPLSVCLSVCVLLAPPPVSPFSQQVFLSVCSLCAHPHICILSVWQTNCFLFPPSLETIVWYGYHEFNCGNKPVLLMTVLRSGLRN